MNINGVWILGFGILALLTSPIITRWMSPIGNKRWGLLAGLLGGLIGLVVLEILGGIDAPALGLPTISAVDAFDAAVISLFAVSAFSAAIGLLVNWLLYSLRHQGEPEGSFAE